MVRKLFSTRICLNGYNIKKQVFYLIFLSAINIIFQKRLNQKKKKFVSTCFTATKQEKIHYVFKTIHTGQDLSRGIK